MKFLKDNKQTFYPCCSMLNAVKIFLGKGLVLLSLMLVLFNSASWANIDGYNFPDVEDLPSWDDLPDVEDLPDWDDLPELEEIQKGLATMYEYNTEIVFQVQFEGTALSEGVLVALIGDEIRGAQYVPVTSPFTGTSLFSMFVYNDEPSGDTISFVFYDTSRDEESEGQLFLYRVYEKIPFVADQVPDYAKPEIINAYCNPVGYVTGLMPVDNQENVGLFVDLHWHPSPNTILYLVYFWEDGAEIPDYPLWTVADTSFQVDSLSYASKYNWKVIAANECSTAESEVHSFTTMSLPDFAVSDVQAPDTAMSGHQFSVTYTVANIGGPATASQWKDAFYLSGNETLDDNDLVLSEVDNLRYLVPDSSYTNTVSLQLPDGMSGNYFIIVEADVHDVAEEISEENNIAISGEDMYIELEPRPDITVSAISAGHSTVNPGDSLQINWTVKNIGGDVTYAGWNEVVSIISDSGKKLTFSPTEGYGGELQPGAEVNRSSTYKIPEIPQFSGSASIQVELVPDEELGEYESALENNTVLSEDKINFQKELYLQFPYYTVNEGSSATIRARVTRTGENAQSMIVSLSELNGRISVPASVTIPANSSSVVFYPSVIDDDIVNTEDTTVVTATASGYGEVSKTLTVIDNETPTLSLAASVSELGEGDTLILTVARQLVNGEPLTVYLSCDKTNRFDFASEITIPANEAAVQVVCLASNNSNPALTENIKFTVTAPDYIKNSCIVSLTDDDVPTISLSVVPDTVSETGGYQAAVGTITIDGALSYELAVHLTDDSDGALYYPSSKIYIKPGNTQKQFSIGVVDNNLVDGTRKYNISASVFISSSNSSVPETSNGFAQAGITVLDNDGPALQVVSSQTMLPEGKTNATTLTITRNTSSDDSLVVNITSSSNADLNFSRKAVIPQGGSSVKVPVSVLGNDIIEGNRTITFTVSAENFSSGVCWAMITDRTLSDATVDILSISNDVVPAGGEINAGFRVINEGVAIFPANVELDVYLCKGSSFSSSKELITTLYTTGNVRPGDSLFFESSLELPEITGDYYIIAEINSDESPKELSYLNNVSEAMPIALVAPFSVELETDKINYQTKDTVHISGRAIPENFAEVAEIDVEVYIINDGNRSTYTVTTDKNGDFQLDYLPALGQMGRFVAGGCYPGEGLDEEMAVFNVYGLKRTSSSYIVWETDVMDTLRGTIELANPTSLPLTNLQSELFSESPDWELTFDSIPDIPAEGTVDLGYAIVGKVASTSNQYEKIKFEVNSAEGASLDITAYYYCYERQPSLVASISGIETTMCKGKTRNYSFTITNEGKGETGPITVSIPSLDWMSLTTPVEMPSLAFGESGTIELELTPGDDLPVNVPLRGRIGISCENGSGLSLNYRIETVSEETGTLVVDVCDEYTYYTEEAPHLAGASVTIKHPYTGEVVARGVTGEDGLFTVPDLEEGYYAISVTADRHDSYNNNILVDPGTTTRVQVDLSYQAISYTWEVVETEVEDVYDIETIVEYETNVPVPVVRVTYPDELQYEDHVFNVVVTNTGLVSANDVTVNLPTGIDGVHFEPLGANPIAELPPHTSSTIPVRMTVDDPSSSYFSGKVGETGGYSSGSSIGFSTGGGNSGDSGNVGSGGCFTISISTIYYWYCGQWRSRTAAVGYRYGDCASTGTVTVVSDPGTGGPGTPYISGGGGGGGGGSSSLIPIVPVYVDDDCDTIKSSYNNDLADFPGNYLPTYIVGEPILKSASVSDSSVDFLSVADIVFSKPVPSLEDLGLWLKKLLESGIEETNTSYIDVFQERIGYTYDELLAIENLREEIFKNENWLDCDPAEWDMFFAYLQEIGYENGITVDNDLLDYVPTSISTADLNWFVERWNNSVKVAKGEQVSGDNYVDLQLIEEYWNIIKDNEDIAYSYGYTSMKELLSSEYVAVVDKINQGTGNSVCATVSLKISQTMTMTRQAFEGTLTVLNGNESDPMQEISLNLKITDEEGNVAGSDKFQVNTENLENITGIDGTGILDAQQTGVATVMFIPTKNAAPTISKTYYFGGTLSYLDPFTGTTVTRNLYPVALTVKPSPDLTLTYFMQRDVYGDDALTLDVVEPSVPAEFALLIENKGAGDASNVHIATSDPEIIDNEKGLLIDFEMVGASLNGAARSSNFENVDFGDIDAGQTAYAQWYLTSSLLGHFIDYDVSYTHATSYDNPDLSLIDTVTIHELIHTLSIEDESGSLAGFLVNDITDVDDAPDIIYATDGSTMDVAQASSYSYSNEISVSLNQTVLTVTPDGQGWNYIKTDDPGKGKYEIVSVTRGDGKVIPLENVWQTWVTITDGQEPFYEDKIHLADEFADGTSQAYTIVFEVKDQDPVEIVRFENVPEEGEILTSPHTSVNVVFNKPIDPATFTYEDLYLGIQGVDETDASIVINQIDDYTFEIDLSEKSVKDGYYYLTVQSNEISDLTGITGEVGKSVAWVQYLTVPAIIEFGGLPENNVGAAFDTMTLEFNMAIDTLTNELLTWAKDSTEIPATVGIDTIGIDGKQFMLTGLKSFMDADAGYSLEVDMSGIQSSTGVAGLGTQSVAWTVDQTGPEIVHFSPIENSGYDDQHYGAFDVGFNENVKGFGISDIELWKNEEKQSIGQVVVVGDSANYKLSAFGDLTYYDGDYEIKILMEGISDEAGNVSLDTFIYEWNVERELPQAVTDLRIAPDMGYSDTDAITATTDLTVSMMVNEPDCRIQLYVEGQSGTTLLADSSGVYEGNLSVPVELDAGSLTLKVVCSDSYENSVNTELPVYIDQVPLVATWEDIDYVQQDQLDTILLSFSARLLDDSNLKSALSFEYGDELLDASNLNVEKTSERIYKVSGLSDCKDTKGLYYLSVNTSLLQKRSSGMSGSSVARADWEVENKAPVVDAGEDQTVTEGDVVHLDGSAEDEDNDNLTYTWTAPGGIVLDDASSQTPSFVAPEVRRTNDYLFTLSVDDGTVESQDWVTITVENVNKAPVVTNPTIVTATEDVEYSCQLTATDADGDRLSYSLGTYPTGMSIDANVITWTPTEGQLEGEVEVIVSDGALSDTTSFTITVTPVNDAPVFTTQPSTEATEDVEYTLELTAEDAEDSTLTYSLGTYPTGMSINGNEISWTPAEGQLEGGVVVTVSDGELSDTLSFTITVTPVNDAPVITSHPNTSATEDVEYTYAITAEDPEDSTLTYSLETYPTGMTINGNEISWTPVEGQLEGEVGVTVSDGDLFDTLSFTITVTPVNDAPVFTAQPNTVATEDIEYVLKITAEDPEDSTLTYELVSFLDGMELKDTVISMMPVAGDFEGKVLCWTPAEGQLSGEVALAVSDGDLSDTLSFTITVTPVNDAPVITSQPNTSATEDIEYTYAITAEDPEDSTLTYSLGIYPTGMTIEGNEISWTPAEGQLEGEVEVIVSDGELADTLSFTINVTPVNDVPVITSQPNTSATEDIEYTYAITAEDAEDSTLVYSLGTYPTGMSIDGNEISWTPAEGQLEGEVDVIVSDGEFADTLGFTINVTPVNDAPVITSQPNTSATEDIEYTYAITAEDPEDSTLTYSLGTYPTGMAINGNEISWTPAEGQLEGEVTLVVSDGSLADTSSFTITVTPVNDAPVITSQPNTSATEDVEYTYATTAEDAEDSTLVYSLETYPVGMSIDGNEISWTPAEGQLEGEVDVIVSDGELNDTLSFTITVTPVNDAPVITSQPNTSATEDVEYSYAIIAEDSEDSTLTYSLGTYPTGMSINGNEISWTPAEGQLEGEVTLVVSDGSLADTSSFTISVTPVNDAPVITSQPNTSATEDVEYTYVITAEDAEDSTLTYSLGTYPAGMSINGNEISWTPVEGQLEGEVEVIASDGEFADTLSFTINVTPVNDAPVITSQPNTSATEDVEYTYAITAEDPEDSTLTYSLETYPTGMTIDGNEISWTPVEGQLEGEVTLVVSDGSLADTSSFTITVMPVNDAPVITSQPNTSATEDVEYSYTVTAEDAEDSTLIYSLETYPTGMTINGNVISWTPAEGQLEGEVEVIASDGEFADTLSFTINVTPVNDVPVITSQPNTSATEDIEYTYAITAEDAEDSTLTYSLGTYPTGMTIEGNEISWTPVEGQLEGEVTLVVSDGSLADTSSFTISVTPVNDAPVITSQPNTSATEDIEYTYAITAEDPEDSTLTYSLGTYPTGMSINGNEISWTPAEGQLEGEVTLVVSDGSLADTSSFTISVTPVNDAPVITSQPNTSATEDIEYTYATTAEDAEDSTLVYSLGTYPVGMSINGNEISWTPVEGQLEGEVDVIVSDGELADTLSFTINVTPVNDAPVITSQPNTSATEDIEYTYATTAEDAEDSTLTYSLETYPTGMTINGNEISWTPVEGQLEGEVEVIVSDGELADTLSFTINVTQVNDAPVITSQPNTSATEDIEYTYAITAEDPEDSTLTYSLGTYPTGMSINGNEISWTPVEGQLEGEVTLAVSDGDLSDTLSFTITVTPVNDAPVITSQPNTSATEDVEYSYTVTAEDAEDSTLVYSLETYPVGMSIEGNEISWTPAEGQLEGGVVVTVSDGELADTLSFTINVTPVNDAPVITSQPNTSATEDIEYTYAITAEDPEDSTLTYSLETYPTGMSIDGNEISWTPVEGQLEGEVTLVVSDGSLADTSSFTISVTPVNDAPVITSQPNTSATEDVEYTYAITAEDVEDSTLTYSLETYPTAMSINGNEISWTPVEGQLEGEVTLVVSDGSLADTSSFTITVTPVNDAPVITSQPNTSATEDIEYTYAITAEDAEDSTLTYSLETYPTGMTINGNVISWTPVEGQLEGEVTLVVSDGSLADTSSFTITVTPVNNAPVITSQPNTSATEGVEYSYTVTAEDPEDSTLTYSFETYPVGMSINGNEISWTPVEGQLEGEVEVIVSDGSLADTSSFTITVTPVNDAPVITSQPNTSATEDVEYSYTVTAEDAEDSTLVYSLPTHPDGMEIDGNEISWTPIEGQLEGEVEVVGSDGELADTLSFTITVTPVNDVPVITSQPNTSATEDIEYTYAITAEDAEDSTLTYSLGTYPTGMTIEGNEISWTPVEGQLEGEVTLVVSDGSLADTSSFTITVMPVNDAPVITSQPNTSATEDIEYSYAITAEDAEDSTLTYSLGTYPTGMAINGNEISWTPVEGQLEGEVTLVVSDGSLADTSSFTITVAPVNDAPVITSQPNTSVTEGIEYTYAITAEDAEDSTLTYSLETYPTGMSIDGNEISWTPVEGQLEGEVTLVVSDGSLADTSSFTISVTPVNDAPVITSQPNTSAIEDVEYTYVITAEDAEDSTLTYSLETYPVGMSINGNEISWTPAEGQLEGEVTLVVSDGSLADTSSFTITVMPVNDAPVITSQPNTSATEDVEYSYTVTAEDAEDSTLVYSLETSPAGMSITGNVISWTPAEGIQSGEVVLVVSDGELSDTSRFTITVTQVNSAPEITSTPITVATEDEEYVYEVTAADAESSDLTYSLQAHPSGMEIDGNIITWTPAEGQLEGEVVVVVSDGELTDVSSFTIAVTPVNDAPEIASSAITVATEDEEYVYEVAASDAEGSDLVYSLPTHPDGMEINGNEISWTPIEGQLEGLVELVVSDGELADTSRFTITVTPVNDAPEITSEPITVATEDEEYIYEVAATDEEGSNLTYKLLNGPVGMYVDENVIRWTPSKGGVYADVVLVVSDGELSDISRFTIRVENKPAYTVRFVVTNAAGPIAGANVELFGYGPVETDDYGIAEVSGVVNDDGLLYLVKASGHNSVWGALVVEGSDLTENVSLLAAHTVSFSVRNETSGPIAGAAVTLDGYGTVLTNRSGGCYFYGVVDSESLSFEVSANGYDDQAGNIAVNGADVTQNVSLEASQEETYSILLAVVDRSGPVQGASVSVSGYGTKTTNADGLATFDNVYPEALLTYCVSANGYNLVFDYTQVLDEDVSILVNMTPIVMEKHDVTFVLSNGGNFVRGAMVSLGKYGWQRSNSSGRVTFNDVDPAENVKYSVFADDYYLLTGAVDIESDTVFNLAMESTIHTVNFRVVDNNNEPVQGAYVMFDDYGTLLTDADGKAAFEGVSSENNIPYCVYSVGYGMKIGTVSVSNSDMSKIVRLSANKKVATIGNYNVGFTVLNGTSPVSGATVYFGSYGIASTDSQGKASFSNIAPSEIEYCVNIDGYGIVIGNVSVVSSDENVVINIQEETYAAEFYVNEDGVPVSGATVSLQGFGAKQTDADGKAVFTDIEDGANLSYFVSVAGYDLEYGNIIVEGEDVSETINLYSAKASKVSFVVKYGDDMIEGATVALSGYGTVLTDANGIAVFDSVSAASGISYSVLAENYNMFSGTVTVDGEDVEKEVDLSASTYQATFTVSSGPELLNGATVSVGGFGSRLTNENGAVTFLNIPSATELNYQVTAPAYKNAEGRIMLAASNLAKNVELEFVGVEVRFAVVDGDGNPIENAGVTFNGETLFSDIDGEILFEGVGISNSMSYSVSLNGYSDNEGSIDVTGSGASETVVMVWTGVDDFVKPQVKVYPNPASHIVFVENVEGEQIDIYNLQGRLVKQIASTSNVEKIDVSAFRAGIYLIKVNDVITKLVVKPNK